MEIMEEGNMMDRVRILLQRDLGYYQAHQTVLQENLCPGVVGGLLDFPRYASFAAVKLVLWWEEEYVAAFRGPSGLLETATEDKEDEEDRGCGGVAKNSAPGEFVSVVTQSASMLLEHLHTLSQEALDHADLTVLTGTLGAAALIKNCLWCYNEQLKRAGDDKLLSVHSSYKEFHEMAEALAERLLDLHCRLLSLYILQDSNCLHWEDPHPFFEGERGSFVVQMWWLYMQGTKEDLWNTVPPKMAQRVLAGMLNESLTILTVRYTQAMPSRGRSSLLVADVSNLLVCVHQLLPAICCESEELVGRRTTNKVLRDVHTKCHELLCCLLLRGCPLAVLYKVFRRGTSGVEILSHRNLLSPAPWFVLTSPHLFSGPENHLSDGAAVALELSVLAAQPQASWPLLLKVLMMRQCKVASLVMNHYMQHLADKESSTSTTTNSGILKPSCQEKGKAPPEVLNETGHCGGFLCSGGGDCLLGPSLNPLLSPGVIVSSLVYVVAGVGGPTDLASILLPPLERNTGVWAICLDHKQDGAQTHEATALALDCLCQLSDCVPSSLHRAASLLEDILPADVHPVGDSVLLQLLVLALYSHLVCIGGNNVIALAETLCNLGQLSTFADKMEEFVSILTESCESLGEDYCTMEAAPHMEEALVSKILFTSDGRAALKHHSERRAAGRGGRVERGEKVEVINLMSPGVPSVSVCTGVYIVWTGVSSVLARVTSEQVGASASGSASLAVVDSGSPPCIVLWQFLQHSSQWVLGQLKVLEPGVQAPTSPSAIPSTASRPAPPSLLHTMFYMGHRPFDELLAGAWEPDWTSLLHTPLGLSQDRLWTQLSRRFEFQGAQELLSEHDATVVASLTSLFSSVPATPQLH
uniref:Uncharacterized protein n=1 Tax=Timema monikensis TaxID=170555 RepID=A0A7R9E205_9NEOP|nr:unnamed protein product [Timema monikensis]